MRLRKILGICIAVFSPIPFLGQQPAPALAPDVKAYLDQASQVMLQRTAGNPSFELNATFTATSADAGDKQASAQSGTYQETWRSPTEWRRDVTLGGAKFSFGRDGDQVWRLPKDVTVPAAVYSILNCIVPLIPSTDWRPTGQQSNAPLKLTRVKLGNVEVDRIGDADHQPRGGKRSVPELAYYFVPESHLLISRATGTGVIEFSKAATVAGKTVLMAGTSVSLVFPRVDFAIVSLKSLPADAPLTFAAPAGALAVRATNAAGNEFQPPHCIKCSQPVYPLIAKSAHVSGTVVTTAVIGTDGSVSDVRLISGAPLLRQATVDAVRTWQYEPPILDGLPVPMETIVVTTFTIN